jgi:hypothetical protein
LGNQGADTAKPLPGARPKPKSGFLSQTSVKSRPHDLFPTFYTEERGNRQMITSNRFAIGTESGLQSAQTTQKSRETRLL